MIPNRTDQKRFVVRNPLPNSYNSLRSLSTLEQRCTGRGTWDCGESITPLTTRPHFVLESPIRRVRSRSLGTYFDATAREEAASRLLLPSLTKENLFPQILESRLIPSPLPSPVTSDDGSAKNPVWICILYGAINATIVLPILMSFGSIIYRDDAFLNYIPVLVKLTVVSGIVHQVCFSTFSSLPFAVGQVQDAGLIFLSNMASQIAQQSKQKGHDDETMLATVTVGLGLGTAMLGCGLVLVGYLKLGQYVQLLPTSVVGGYLAFIGWFCGSSGVGLMAGTSEVTPKVIIQQFRFILPGLLGGSLIYLAVTRMRHMAALPLSILMELVLFYIILGVTDTSVLRATELGWIRQMDDPPPWYHTWDFLKFDRVDWSCLPSLALTEIGMILVVALSSSLDVAAIELELKRPLDYNHELRTVGLSNIVSGITGGYTGSYIFSQSIFSLRAGIRSRLAGFVLAGCQILVLVCPFPILKYVPNCFFGSLLIMICIDLMFEWLWDVRTRLTTVEYSICLTTFALIQILGVEYGIVAGVLLFLACKRMGLNVGVAKFSTHEDDLDDLRLETSFDEGNGHDRLVRYGTA